MCLEDNPFTAITHTDGTGLKCMVEAGLFWLEKHHEAVNALNVFPVPDGDTGTNMLLTMQSAYRLALDHSGTHAGQMAHSIYSGALRGARGNSGVILSQLWRGLAETLQDYTHFGAPELANGLQKAVQFAYQAVQHPTEGTILTVAREAFEAGQQAAAEGGDLRLVMSQVTLTAKDSLLRTPDLLPILKETGTVDSGGAGLVYLLEGMLHRLENRTPALPVTVRAPESASPTLNSGPEENYNYDVQFLLQGQALDVAQVRADIEAMGDSGVIVGDRSLIKVHIHVDDPGVPLSYGAARGVLLDVVVENMQLQAEAHASKAQGVPTGGEISTEHAGGIAVITVAPGPGIGEVFRSLGAAHVIAGGQTMNPSIGDLLDAARSLPQDTLIFLPNNRNIVLAAQEAAKNLNGKEAHVIRSLSVPEGIAALLAFDPDEAITDALSAMQNATEGVETGEITRAVRATSFNGLAVAEGQVIGLHNDVLCVAGDDVPEVLFALLERMGADQRELITLYFGEDVSQQQAEQIGQQIAQRYADQELEIRSGGQPLYDYIISVE